MAFGVRCGHIQQSHVTVEPGLGASIAVRALHRLAHIVYAHAFEDYSSPRFNEQRRLIKTGMLMSSR